MLTFKKKIFSFLKFKESALHESALLIFYQNGFNQFIFDVNGSSNCKTESTCPRSTNFHLCLPSQRHVPQIAKFPVAPSL
jgi:hypothetical protein